MLSSLKGCSKHSVIARPYFFTVSEIYVVAESWTSLRSRSYPDARLTSSGSASDSWLNADDGCLEAPMLHSWPLSGLSGKTIDSYASHCRRWSQGIGPAPPTLISRWHLRTKSLRQSECQSRHDCLQCPHFANRACLA